MGTFWQTLLIVGGATMVLAVVLTLLPRLGKGGRCMAEWLSRAPGVDAVVALLTWGPWLVAGLAWGWIGVGGALLGQLAALYGWIFLHEIMHRQATRGPRLVKVHHKLVGRWRNQLSLALTVVGVPVLWAVRLPQVFAYPLLIWLLGFPRYRHGEWVNLSRHKFQDLVGHDLVWCLYCDWMTGVWSLGSEMLRNIESFWCPIRFLSEKKNEHARIDFPDLASAWVPAEGTMAEAAALLEEKYDGGRRSWFGHPDRHETLQEQSWVDEVHRQILSEHSHQPRHCRAMAHFTHRAEGHTPVCNDRVEVYLRLEEGRIADISFTASACGLCTASASLMSQQLHGRSIEQARQLYAAFHMAMLRPTPNHDPLGDLTALTGIHRFPGRIKCATLPWHTMNAALDSPTQDQTGASQST